LSYSDRHRFRLKNNNKERNKNERDMKEMKSREGMAGKINILTNFTEQGTHSSLRS
jgi:hypothetical protein